MSGAPGPAAGAPTPPCNSRKKAPGALKQFWWDLLPKNSPDWLVPRRSGLNPPEPEVDWITAAIAANEHALDQTRRAHDLARDRADSLEKKAIPIVTLCLSLLAIALVIGGYQLGYLRRHHSGSWWLLAPAAASVVCLVFAAIAALEVQRVGVYQWEGAEPLGREPGGVLGLVQAEEKGRRFAEGTALIKANGFLQARAWLSRALVTLILAAIVTIGMATKPTASGQRGGVSTPRTSIATTPPASSTSTTNAR
jgi:hypothetical protein